MPTRENDSLQLIPPLREDLELFPAPREEGGEPVWTVYDPLNSEYLRADWAHFEIIKRLDRPQHLSELIDRLTSETTLRPSSGELVDFIYDLARMRLLRSGLHCDAGSLNTEHEAKKSTTLQWLLHHYLYFRIPLLSPDSFLASTLDRVKPLASRTAFGLYLVVALLGLYFLSFRFNEYTATFTDFLNWKGALAYGLAIAALKCVHEFSHAYTARALGNKVKTMGLAFIVMWPVPYCDVTDSWRMSSRRRRLLISFAGIIAELVVAAFSLFLWGVCEGQLTKGLFFVLSSVSIAGTLLVNLNPAMRFDGYYIFSDLIGVDNLLFRSSQFLKWYYRQKLLGVELPSPEPFASSKRKVLLTAYAVCSWIYRFFLYLGIALVVYYSFPKIIGIVLFGVEILFFILLPAIKEAQALYFLRHQLWVNHLSLILSTMAAGIFIWALLPFPRYTRLPALIEPVQNQVIYAPVSGKITEIVKFKGSEVNKDELILQIESFDLLQEIEYVRHEQQKVLTVIKQTVSRTHEKPNWLHLQQQTLSRINARLRKLHTQLRQCRVTALFSGRLYSWDDAVRVGSTVQKGQELGYIAGIGQFKIIGFASSDETGYIPKAANSVFIPTAPLPEVNCKILSVAGNREEFLQYPALSTTNGGDISTTLENGARLPSIVGSFYQVIAMPVKSESRSGQVGELAFWSSGYSYIHSICSLIWRTIIRESGF